MRVAGEWGPVVAGEDGAAEELDEPGPVGGGVVVGRGVEADPAAVVGHVAFEGGAVLGFCGLIVEPEDDKRLFGVEVGQAGPVGGGGEGEVIALGECGVEADGLVGEGDVVGLDGVGVEGEDLGLLGFCEQRRAEQEGEDGSA